MCVEPCMYPGCERDGTVVCQLCELASCIECTLYTEDKTELYRDYNLSTEQFACIYCFIGIMEEVLMDI